MTNSAEHWTQFFQHDYVAFSETILHAERTAYEIEKITEILDLPPGAAVLDLGCGQGRISIPLALRGYKVTGYDSSAALLEVAAQRASSAGADIRWIHGDMRDLSFLGEFDAIINVGTAFGYVREEKEDADILCRVHAALRSGGVFLQDLENRERKLRKLAARTWEEMGQQPVWSRREFDCITGRWTETISWMKDGELETRILDLRLYAATEIIRLTDAAGLTVRGVYGGLDRSALSPDSLRMVIVSER
ncbi:class I SAM-dependent methyltransferase [Paenibacillus sambharensis]|uniref:Class I SAM-dependent methyltransferase n=1 Tax=Paenibacillus sambharensis TaxID=1803190 RepID=A0A2W1LDE9_9BACL|nr:class I SAM-dependent methyltransferase [Paenibacillus sambharensis]PZD96833.1 class I SAM-dependent methyltransferase [Paenibacillus sambharensis]